MNKILFIVEGQNDEVKFIKRLFQVCSPLQKYEVVPYKTNLHNLVKYLFIDENIDDTLDIKQVLKSNEKDPIIKQKLSGDFSDIFLIFDFEPQQDCPRFNLIKKMLGYFSSSTDNGKLFINYPMMQSYKHFTKLPDISFRDLMVTQNDAKNYKQLVSSISAFNNTTHHSYSLFISIAYHHLLKSNFIRAGKYAEPTVIEFYNWTEKDLFDIQCNFLNTKNEIYVVNTFTLFLIEYNPTEYFNQIHKHKKKYSI